MASRDLQRSRLRSALLALGPYYGINSASPIHGEMLSSDDINLITFNPLAIKYKALSDEYMASLPGAISELVSSITSFGESTPVIGAIVGEGQTLLSVNSSTGADGGQEITVPILVTPSKDLDSAILSTEGGGLVNQGYDALLMGEAPAKQGWGTGNAGSYMTTDACMSAIADDMRESAAKVSAIQIFSPSAAPNVDQADIVAFFANGIPPAEMNQCIPYLEVVITSNSPPGTEVSDGDESAHFAPMTLYKFLLGPSTTDTTYAGPMGSAKWDGLPNGEPIESADGTGPPDPNGAWTQGGMELFTMPQSMVNAESTALDPFRPFMSITEFKQKLDADSFPKNRQGPGAGGMSPLGNNPASLRLRLHDKSRLGDIAGLLNPSMWNSTQIIITMGWSHPQNLRTDRPADADLSAKFGDVLGAMKVSQAYQPSNSRFSFEQSGEVSIDLTLTTAAFGIQKFASSVLQNPGSNETSAEDYQSLLGELRSTITMGQDSDMSQLGAVGTSVLKQVMAPISREGSGFYKDTADVIKAIKAVISDLKAGGDTRTAQQLLPLEKLMIKHAGAEENPVVNVVTMSGVAALKKNLQEFERKADPFLRPRYPGVVPPAGPTDSQMFGKRALSTPGRSDFCSLGKLIVWFVGGPMRMSSAVKEIQFVFYAMNANSGGTHDYNIASLPIQWTGKKGIKKGLEDNFKDHDNMTLKDFLTFIEKYVADENAPMYGRSKRRQRTSSMQKIYNPGSEGGVGDLTWQKPQLKILPWACSGRPTLAESGNLNSSILKIHVYDAATKSGGQRVAEQVISAMGRGFAFQKILRDNSPDKIAMGVTKGYPFASNHQASYDKALDHLEKIGVITKLDPAKIASCESVLSTKQWAKIKDGYYIILPSQLAKLKGLMTQMTPTLIIGSSNSAIEQVSVQTIADRETKNLELIRRGNAADKEARAKEKIPPVNFQTAPVQMSITMLGCPFVRPGQSFFIDAQTNTDVDNLYTVHEIEHTIGAGKFQTSIIFKQSSFWDTEVSLDDDIGDILAIFANRVKL
jgi:hypothetical protein